MDFMKSFSYVFEDPDWVKKVVVIALVGLIPLVGFIVMFGWSLEATRRVIQRDRTPLPNLNFGEQLGLGFKGMLVALVYAIPIFILQIPVIVGASMLENGSTNIDPNVLNFLAVCCTGVTLIYALFLELVLPAALGNFIAQNRLSAGLKFGQVFGLVRANPGAYLLAMVGVLLAGILAPIGLVACLVGALFTYAYALAVQGHLYGQAYLAAVHNQAYR